MFKMVLAPLVLAASMPTFAATILDFENLLPGMEPMRHWQGEPVPASARITDQYLSLGVRIGNAALVLAGLGHSASGANSLAGIAADGRIDYDQPVSFSFFTRDGRAATTDSFAYSADCVGDSGNVVTLTAFAVDGRRVGQARFVERGTFSAPLTLSGIGPFHEVVVDQTLYVWNDGGITIDRVTFGELRPVPEPGTWALMAAGFGALGWMARRRRH